MQLLYDVMDPSFSFKLPEGEQVQAPAQRVQLTKTEGTAPKTAASSKEKSETLSSTANVIKDFRGVGCPMNFVKTKMALAKMQSRELLEVWLDDGAPIENVPGSVREEGHKVLEQKRVNGHWTVLIEKQ